MSQSYRACWSSYLVLTVCVGLLPAITLPIGLRGDHGASQVTALGLAVLLFTYFWLSRFKLTVTPRTITYSSLYSGERTVNLSEVEASEIVCQTFYLFYRRFLLEVRTKDETLRINYKVFSREAVRTVFHVLGLTRR